MEFYQMIGKYYDDLFPPSQSQIQFLLKLLSPHSQVLDLGCATGGYALALAEQGHAVTAIDLDEAMIHILENKLKHKPLPVSPMVGDIQQVAELSGTYDLIYCIGNTVVHLESLNAFDQFLQDVHGKLNPGGRLVIQSVNYDRILKDKVQSLPQINREYPVLSFFRRYHHESDHIRFEGTLTLEAGADRKMWTAETRLLPILKEDFKKGFIKAGYSEMGFYGDFNESPFSLDSQALVTLTVK